MDTLKLLAKQNRKTLLLQFLNYSANVNLILENLVRRQFEKLYNQTFGEVRKISLRVLFQPLKIRPAVDLRPRLMSVAEGRTC